MERVRQLPEVETFHLTDKVRLTVAESSEMGIRMFVLSVGNAREVLSESNVRSIATVLQALTPRSR